MRVQQNYEQVLFDPDMPVKVTVRQSRVFRLHWHNQAELLYVVNGSMLFHVDGEDYVLSEGQMMYVSGGELHGVYRTQGKSLLIVIQFDSGFFRLVSGAERCRFNRDAFVRDQSSKAQGGFFSQDTAGLLLGGIVWEYNKRPRGFPYFIAALALRLLGQMARGGYLTPEPPHTLSQSDAIQRMGRILDFIKDHYRENITLQSIARDAHVSYYYLSRSFREVTGFSFREHLRQVRAQKSLAALQDTKDSILNIALASGFPTVKSYTSAFQARYGVSPTQYRRNARRSGIASVDTPASFAFNGGNNPAYTPANSADDLNLIYAKFNTAAAYSVLAGPGPALSDNSYMNRGG